MPGAGGDAGARHHPAAARGGVRPGGGAGAAARAGAALPGPGVERGQGAARFPCPGAERVLLGALPAGRAAGHGAGGRDAGEDLPPRPGDPHPPAAAGGRASDAADFPPGTDIYARRDVDKLAKMAAARGEAIGIYAARILDTPLPWTRMRAVYALIGLARTYGSDPVRAGLRGRAGARRDQRRQDQVDRGEGHREAGRAGRRAQPPGRRRRRQGHRGPVRPRPPRVRHRDRRPHAGPARRPRRRQRRLTAPPPARFHFISIHFIALRLISFRSAVPRHGQQEGQLR